MNSPANNTIFKPAFLAEAVFASLREAGHRAGDIQIHKKGGFKKGFSNDVDQVLMEPGDHRIRFEMYLNRNGLYDVLPEGLFHQSKGAARVTTVQDAVDEHRQFKEEEKLARNFFAPLEALLFLYGADAEMAERSALYDIQNGKLGTAFYQFWNVDADSCGEPAGRLLRLMPYADRIKSDIKATAAALACILETEIGYQASLCPDKQVLPQPGLHELCLGIDATIGNTTCEDFPCWIFTFKGIAYNELTGYCEGGTFKKIIDRFVEIFIPVDIDTVFDFEKNDDLRKEKNEHILGVGAFL